MDTQAPPEPTGQVPPQEDIVPGPPIRLLFRDVIADCLSDRRPPQAAMLLDSEVAPFWGNRSFLADFYNDILHQDTCQPTTADGIVLLAALAVDDRVPARHRFEAMQLLFNAATVTDRHLAESWPATPLHADLDSEARTRSAVQACTPDLLARWSAECPANRLALAGLAVLFPTGRTLPALTPRLRGFTRQHPPGTDVGDYVRFILVLASQDANQTLAATEEFTDAYWTGTPRAAPTRARALHLLGEMLARVKTGLIRSNGGQ
ncbi:hypothetical protein [Streptomyces sp. NPDC060035]|uniref:hypothetical protein n=1 Tax=Streptomyces sp. NPDC060035 TaxID=3347044 RepID=UPI0036995482